MYYELYIDVFFLTNFMMDYLLLLFINKSLKCTATHGSICLGAIMGAFLTCLIVICPIPYVFIKFVLFHVFVNTYMIRAGLKIKTKAMFAKAIFMLYVGAFLLGGILHAVQTYVRIGSLFFAFAVGGYYLISGIWDVLSNMQKKSHFRCQVNLFLGEKNLLLEGLIDTGNSLCDPATGQPVHILDRKTMQCFASERVEGRLRYVPFHSIGKKEGLLLVVQMDRMHVCGENECWIEKPLIGISDELVSVEGEYKMILNPNSF